MVRVVGVLRMVRVVRDGWSWRGTMQKSKKLVSSNVVWCAVMWSGLFRSDVVWFGLIWKRSPPIRVISSGYDQLWEYKIRESMVVFFLTANYVNQ